MPEQHSSSHNACARQPRCEGLGAASSVSPAQPHWWTIALSIAGLAGMVAALAGLHIDRSGTTEAGTTNLRGLWLYWIASGFLWLCLTAVWWSIRSRARALAGSAPGGVGRTVAWIIGIALAARVAVLITHEPSLSDDVYRYVFDGQNAANLANPYLVTPIDRLSAAEEAWPGERELLPLLAYPELPTPYLPVSHGVFAALGLLIDEAWSDPAASARVFRIGFVATEAAMMLMLAAALRRAGRSPWMLSLYAWHPLPLSEFAGSGHQDITGIALLVAGLLCWMATPTKVTRWTALIALSAMVKPVAAPAAIFLLRGRPWRHWLRSVAVGAVVCAIVAAPWWLLQGDGSRAFLNWKSTADAMVEKWAHFAGPYEVAEFTARHCWPQTPETPPGWNLVQEMRARKFCAVLLAVSAVVIFAWPRGSPWQRTAALLLAATLLTPTAHPWYLLWGFALIPMAFSVTMWVYSLTIGFGYVYFATGRGEAFGETWTVDPRVIALGYLPVAAALAGELWLQFAKRRAKPGDEVVA